MAALAAIALQSTVNKHRVHHDQMKGPVYKLVAHQNRRRYAGSAFKRHKLIFGMLVGLLAVSPIAHNSSADSSKIDLAVECHCPDAVGERMCADFKNQVAGSPGYRLTEGGSGYGIGLHFSCVDLWSGLENGLAGRMSAVSVAFTIYSDKLPGEIYEDSSVFRVGKDATGEMSRKIIAAIGQLVNANETLFKHLREAEQKPSPSP